MARAKRKEEPRGPAFLVRPGAHINKRAAQDIGPVCVKLAQTGGTAEDLLREASDPKSPAHKHFNWDNESAAHEHRLAQARYYWRSFEIVIEGSDRKAHATRQFVVVTDDGKDEFKDIRAVQADEDLAAQVLARAKRELGWWYAKYVHLSNVLELRDVFREVEKVVQP